MIEFLKRCGQCLGAGFLGGMLSALIFLLCSRSGVMEYLGVSYEPGLLRTYHGRGMLPWFYEHLFLSALFGLLFLLPWVRSPQTHRGMVYALVPIAFDLLYVFPMSGRGLFGIEYGGFTFVFVFLFHAIWGMIAVSFAPPPSN